MTVLRIYRVHLKAGKANDYERLERAVGVPTVRSMPGCIACGFGPFKEGKAKDGGEEWAFFSLWRTQEELEMARATPTWKKMVDEIEGHSLASAESAEHIQVRTLSGIALPK